MSLILLTIPGLRESDLASCRNSRVTAAGQIVNARAQLPLCDLSGAGQHDHGPAAVGHGVVANGFYWRREAAGRDVDRAQRLHQRPQIGPAHCT